MSVQYSRGCPFQCEFCDIIVLYGRKPRTKTPQQLLAELDYLYTLGWRQNVFIVDDNFIGNRRNVKLLLQELKVWMKTYRYPFKFNTEASIDLAQDLELMQLMVECNFYGVFVGIETPDAESLQLTKKYQNTRNSLVNSIQIIQQAGLRVTAGFIIGFDGEKAGAGDRIIDFVEQTAIPVTTFGMLHALPNTALWHRLKQEERLLDRSGGDQMTLMNFTPTRSIEEIAQEYVHTFCTLYEPKQYLDRTYRYFLHMAPPRCKSSTQSLSFVELRALLIILWRQGCKRNTRWMFWHHLFSIIRRNPAVWKHYLTVCAFAEHFIEFRFVVRNQIEDQLSQWRLEKAKEERMPKTLNAV